MNQADAATHDTQHVEWSPQRRSAFERFIAQATPPVVATLRVPRLDVTVPIFAGVTEFAMTVGAGHLPDTSPLDGAGNTAVTSHRDGRFRMLKDVQVGELLELRVDSRLRRFVVKRRSIVDPEDVTVLARTSVPTLTLITCYPFWYVGKAPQRYVVQAELDTLSASTTLVGRNALAANPALIPVSFNANKRKVR